MLISCPHFGHGTSIVSSSIWTPSLMKAYIVYAQVSTGVRGIIAPLPFLTTGALIINGVLRRQPAFRAVASLRVER